MQNQLTFENIVLTDGFWKKRQMINKEKTLFAVEQRFEETGRFTALQCKWKEGMPNKPHIFWDSDIAKWVEGASYILQKNPNNELKNKIENVIDLIFQNRLSNGYFNSYFLVTEQDQRFCKRADHELYCLGHWIEAAIAYANATNQLRFLNLICDFVDLVIQIFCKEKSSKFETPGHEEIELALIKLYQKTKQERYLDLCRFFLNQRGNNTKDFNCLSDYNNAVNSQSHLPIRSQTTAEGHAVRAMYLYCAMADLAKLDKDEPLYTACELIFENITGKRMYITGGIGSTYVGESFTKDYHLPNQTAYAETCAAIGLGMFAQRMNLLSDTAKYADVVERTLYNGFLSGVSLDGESFFYENPLEIDMAISRDNSTHLPITQRMEIFQCSCCPPNILRYIACIEGLIYAIKEKTLFVNQYMASISNDGAIAMKTNYPADGYIQLDIRGFKTVALRIPEWCDTFHINQPYHIKNGYAYVELQENSTIVLELDMPIVLIEAYPAVTENAGKLAVMRGPIVYCLEEKDCDVPIYCIRLNKSSVFTPIMNNEYGVAVLQVKSYAITQDSLYRKAQIPQQETNFQMIPYFAFANRGESSMRVWIPKS